MPSNNRVLRHTFGGGLASDLGTLAEISVSDDARVDFQFLLKAENIYYTLNGGVRKIGGTDRYNGTALESGNREIRGMYEYVRQGTGGSPTRKRVAVVGTTIKKDDNDGTFANIFTGIADNSVPNFTVFEDVLVIATDAGEAPKKWDQSTATTLGGSPPNFSFSTVHANRLWAAGDFAAPSSLYYSSLLDAEQWNGTGNSGVLSIDPDDGDVITGIASYRGELIVFKGPNFGSIHRIQGLTPATFERRLLARGVGASWQNTIFTLGTDLGFVAPDGSIRSLLATDQFGDYKSSSISREIETLLQRITFSSLRRAWAVTDAARGYTLFAFPYDTSEIPNYLLMMDTRFERPRFASWPAVDAASLARMTDPANSNQPIIYAGGSDGFLRKLQQNTRSIDGTDSIAARVQTPFTHYNTPFQYKTLAGYGISLQPRGNDSITFGFRHTLQSEASTAQQGGGAVLGSFVIGTDTLGGETQRSVWGEIYNCGQFRDISYEISNVTVDEDMDVQAFYAVIEGSLVESYEN
jgi:hypothetical protein